MEAGFVADYGYGEVKQSTWVDGEPVRSFWTGLKMRGRDKHAVVTYRCPACGYLESYADEPRE
jgi:hypothetical protein